VAAVIIIATIAAWRYTAIVIGAGYAPAVAATWVYLAGHYPIDVPGGILRALPPAPSSRALPHSPPCSRTCGASTCAVAAATDRDKAAMTSSNGPGGGRRGLFQRAGVGSLSADGELAGLMPGHEPHGDDGDGAAPPHRQVTHLMR
jgi:hypothetical protein